MVTVGKIIVASMVMIALVEAVIMAVVMKASEVAMTRRNSLTMTSTNTVNIVRELITIFISAEYMLRSKKRKRRIMITRIMITLLVRAEVMGFLVK